MDKQFDAVYIDKELKEMGARVKKPLNIYLVGGCAMSFRKLKATTKDMDIVFKNKEDYDLFCDALFGAQYHQPVVVTNEYKKLMPTQVYENKDGFHLDLFVGHVMQKLSISKSMIKRAELYKKYQDLTIYLISKPDIFLFKGLASEARKRDLPDMEVLYPNLDWKTILNELESQKLSEHLIDLFISRLEEFNRTYNLDVPILSKLKK